MGFWKRVPDARRSVGDWQHHGRTVDREFPCQAAPLQSLTPFLPALSVERLRFVATNKHWTLEACLENLPRTLQSDEPTKFPNQPSANKLPLSRLDSIVPVAMKRIVPDSYVSHFRIGDLPPFFIKPCIQCAVDLKPFARAC